VFSKIAFEDVVCPVCRRRVVEHTADEADRCLKRAGW
jgi:uncharacterized Zn finger protein (UPF0148 family)